MSASLLEMKKVTIRFGGLTAVSDLDLHIDDRELIGLIGPIGPKSALIRSAQSAVSGKGIVRKE